MVGWRSVPLRFRTSLLKNRIGARFRQKYRSEKLEANYMRGGLSLVATHGRPLDLASGTLEQEVSVHRQSQWGRGVEEGLVCAWLCLTPPESMVSG
jgi:hypothetical protein